MSLLVPHGFLSRGLLLLLLSLGLLLPTPLGGAVPLVHAAPTTWTVTSTGDGTSTPCSSSSACPTLRSALLAAQNGDTIDLTSLSGVITTTTTLTVTTGVTISGPGASVLAVSGSGNHTVFSVTSAAPVTMQGFTVQDGNSASAYDGGGIYSSGSTLTLSAVTLSGNSASDRGGGIASTGSLTITASTLSGNTATNGGGGGIYSTGSLTITASTLSGNTGYNGGGISSAGSLTITASTLSGNTATIGGGISSAGSLTITASTLSGNSSGRGGGISNTGSLTITASTLSGNSASDRGGGISSTGSLTITASTLSGNTATIGGGISSDGSLTITASTLSGNSAYNDGGGISSEGFNGTALVTATTTVLAGNTADSGGACSFTNASLADQGGNLDDDGTCGFTAPTSLSHATSPGLGTLANRGGPTETINLLPGSQALGLGVPAGCAANSQTDQRGFPRPATGCDSGAFQAQLPLTPPAPLTGTVGVAYTSTTPISLTDGTAPITYTLVPDTLAGTGLSLDASSGVIAGTPLSVGTIPLTITARDSVGDSGITATTTLSIGQASTSTSITGCTSGPVFGQGVTCTASVTPQGTAPLSGTVTFFIDSTSGTELGSCTLSSGSCTSSPAYTSVSVAGHSIYAVYGGNTDFLGSTSLAFPLTVSPASTTTSVTGCTPASPVYGQGVICTAAVSVTSPGSGTPPGTVTFRIDDASTGTVLGSCTLVAGSCTSSPAYTSVSAAGHSIYAVYGGNTDFLGSTSLAFPLTVSPASTTTSVTGCTPASPVYGQGVTCTAAVSVTSPGSGTPPGTVTFRIDDASTGTVLGSCTLVAGSCTSSPAYTSVSAAGHSIYAVYGGNTDFLGSTSPAFPLTVSPASTTLVVDPASGTYGGTTTLTATLTAGGQGLSGKTITFSLNGTAVSPTATTDANGVAVLTGVSLAGIGAGSYPYSHASTGVQADFAGDTNDAASVGGNTLTVTSASTTLVVDPASGTYGGTTTLTATLTAGTTPLSNTTITFSLNGTAVSPTATTDANGVAVLTGVSLAGIGAGSYPYSHASTGVQADFAGDTNDAASVGGNTLTVNQASTSTSAQDATATFSAADQQVPLQATVTSPAGTVNEGTVTFTVLAGTTPVGTATTSGTVTNGAASVRYTLPGGTGVGPYTIAAVYNGSTNLTTSTDSSHTLTVQQAATNLTVDPASGPYGGTTTLTATLTAGGQGLSGKTITFSLNGTAVSPTATTDASGVAVLTGVSLAGIGAGSYPYSHASTGVQADFAGDTNDAASTDGNTLTVTRRATSLQLAASPATLQVGQTLTVTATISPTTPSLPTGTVVFTLTTSLGSVLTQTAPLVGTMATTTFTNLPPAQTARLQASYAGDANFLPSSGRLDGKLTQLGCAVRGQVVQRGEGSFGGHAQTPTSPGMPNLLVLRLDTTIDVGSVQVVACSPTGAVQTAQLTGTVQTPARRSRLGTSRLFPPGTVVTITLTSQGNGAASARVSGSNGRVVRLSMEAHSGYRLRIRAIAPQS